MKTYKIAKGWAIFSYIGSLFLIGLFGRFLFFPFANGDFSLNWSWIAIPISLSVIIFMVIGIIDTHKSKIIIDEEKVVSISIRSKKTLKTNEIKGYTIEDNEIIILPKDKTKKAIKISNYIGKIGEIILWLSKRFPNLYEESAFKEKQEILNDKSYGRTVRKRKEKLNQAHNTAKAVNCLGWLSGIWIIFYPYPYQFAIITAIITPLLAITIVVLHKGLIRLDERKGTAFPSVLLAIVLPALGLALRALLDFNITSYAELWLPCLSISIGLFLVVLIANNEVSLKKVEDSFTGITLLIFFAVYAYGLIVTTNCYYDDSIPETYPTEILNKRIHSSKGVIYYLELAAWDNQPEKEVSVSKSFYNKMTVGDSVHNHLKKGCYEIPWFMVRKE